MSYSYMIGDYLQRFEITTSYTSSFTYDPGLVRCDPEHMFYFKTFCDHLNHDAILRPYRYYMAHNNSGACQIEYYQREQSVNTSESESKIKSKRIIKNPFIYQKNEQFQNSSPSEFSSENYYFLLYYIFPYNATHDMIRVYNESTDFRDWNYRTEGKFVEFPRMNESSLIFRPEIVLKEPYWTTGIAAFGSQNESRVFTIVYPILGEYNSTAMNRTIRTENFHVNIKNHTKEFFNYSNYNNNNNDFDFYSNTNNHYNYYQKISKDNSLNNLNYSFNNSNRKQNKDDHKDKDTKDGNAGTKVVLTAVASSFFTESLYMILKARTQAKHSHFIVTDYTYNVLIDNEVGAIFPKFLNDLDQSVFPNISDINSSLWRSVEKEIIEVPIDVPLLVNVSSTVQYMIMKRIIDTRSRYSFYLIMLLELDPTITEIYSSITIVFISCLILIILVVFCMRFSLLFLDRRRKRKLKLKQEQMIASNFNISSMKLDNNNNITLLNSNENNPKIKQIQTNNNLDDNLYASTDNANSNENQNNINSKLSDKEKHYYGTVMDAIEKLRSIQLRNVDDIILNNMIDAAIEEMTRNEDELFNIDFLTEDNEQHKSKDKNSRSKNSNVSIFCPFCKYLINANNNFSTMKENDISIKRLLEKEKIKRNKFLNYILKLNNNTKNDNNNNFYYDKNENRNDDLYSIWNIKINSILSAGSNKKILEIDPHLYLVRMFMKLVQKGNFLFNEFYPDSLLLFILTFTKDNFSCYYLKIRSFHFLKKLLKCNFKFWLKSKTDIFILFLASILRNSKIKKTDQILNLFHSFVGYHNVYFFNLLKVLIDETVNTEIMKIYGDLSNRTLSPNFSISNNAKDTVLFMKALLVFSDFAPYLSFDKLNDNCFNEINKSVFSDDEISNNEFVFNFHLEMSQNVVNPWLNLMNSLAPMIEMQNILSLNIEFWRKKIQIK